jgi:hypothetical protein
MFVSGPIIAPSNAGKAEAYVSTKRCCIDTDQCGRHGELVCSAARLPIVKRHHLLMVHAGRGSL